VPLEAPPVDIASLWWGQLVAFVARIQWVMRRNPGARATSWWRSETKNREVGGSPVSQHLVGLGADFVVHFGSRIQFVNDLRAAGLVPVEELNHVHVQLFPAGVASASIRATMVRIKV